MRISDWSSDVCSSYVAFVPADRDYYDNLIGKGVASSVPQLAAEILAPHINRQLAFHDPDVTRLTLLLASHSSILAASDIAKVSESELVALREWAASSGRSEEHTSELQSLMRISYAVFCLTKKTYTILPY